MMLFCRPMLLLLATLTVGAAPVAVAGDEQQRADDKGSDQQRQRTSRGDDETLSDAVRRVERATQGQILSAERVQFDGRDIHRVKVVDDRGRVRIYVDDPEKSAKSGDGKGSSRTHRDDSDTPNL